MQHTRLQGGELSRIGNLNTNVFVIFKYWIVYAIIDGTFHAAIGQLNAPETTLSAVKNSPTQLQSLIPMATNPQGIDWALAAVAIDTQGQAWAVQITDNDKSNFDFGFVQLSGQSVGSSIGSVGNAVVMIASETDGARIYASDENDSLWNIRQTGYSNGVFSWSEWHPLGDECVVLGTGCTMASPTFQGPPPPVDLFSLDSGYEVNVLSEDTATGQLTDVVMLKPAGSNMNAEYVSRYLTEVTVADANACPQPNFAISVTADTAVGIWVGQILYTVTPDNPVMLTTNPTGTLTFVFFATDIQRFVLIQVLDREWSTGRARCWEPNISRRICSPRGLQYPSGFSRNK